MVKDGKRRRRTTAPSSLEATVATEDIGDILPEDLLVYFKNFTNQRNFEENYKRMYQAIWHVPWQPTEIIKTSVETTTTHPNRIPKGRGGGRIHYDENFDPREDTSNFAEDRYSDTSKGHIYHHVYPKVNPEVPQHPRNWHPVHAPRDPVISFWPVGILIMAVFIVGIISMFLCRAVTPRPRPRRTVLTPPQRLIHGATSESSVVSERTRPRRDPRCPNHREDDDDGGFNEANRRRIVMPGANSSDPPRVVTPPPPYPGTPPGGTVYVNPLDVKPEDASVSGIHGLQCSGTTSTTEELPPPYPGT